jgi:polyhydroxybutyrate depolymerase
VTPRSPKSAWLVALALVLAGCSEEPAVLGDADYARLGLPVACSADQGAAGATNALHTSAGLVFSVRTPRNYDATRAHPLLVVFAPAGFDRFRSERYAGLTTAATSAGFVIAYTDHARLAMGSFVQQGEIAELVGRRWCIDSARVSFAGHSDGGSSAAAVTFLEKSRMAPAGIAVSGAGIRKQDLAQYACPGPVYVLVLHSRRDERFPLPEFGRGPAQWWADCNQCQSSSAPAQNGCVEFDGCRPGSRVRYCELSSAHEEWPPANEELLRFLLNARGGASKQRYPPAAHPARVPPAPR